VIQPALRRRIAGAAALVALAIPPIVVLVRGEELLRHPSAVYWSVWVPALVLVLALLLARSVPAAFYGVAALLAVCVVELAFGVLLERKSVVHDVHIAGEEIEVPDGAASFGARPGGSLTIRRIAEGATEYEVTYTTDEHGRRVTPAAPGAVSDEAVLFFGGSNVYGTGVSDDGTIASSFGRLAPRHRAYNYGYARYGPAQALDVVRSRDLRVEVPEPVAFSFYVLTDADLSRVVGTMRTWESYCRRCSAYAADASGALVRVGDLSTIDPLRTLLWSLLEGSNVLEYLGVDLPTETSAEDYRKTAVVIRGLRDALEERFSGSEFVLVVLPEARFGLDDPAYYESVGLRVLDYRELYSRDDPRMRASATDSHSSALANERVARRIIEDLAPGLGPD
jgi:hypothetical protein